MTAPTSSDITVGRRYHLQTVGATYASALVVAARLLDDGSIVFLLRTAANRPATVMLSDVRSVTPAGGGE